VRESTPRLTWPKQGDKVPELSIMFPSHQTDWLDGWRKWAKDAESVGIKYNIQQLSHARWLNEINGHRHGDIECHPSVLRPERVDPAEWLVSRAYGKDRRNYGEWVNEQYDDLIDKQTVESDPKKRLEYVLQAQQVLAEDLYCMQFGWGPSIIEAFNAERWSDMAKTTGFGIANFNAHHGFLKARPKAGAPNVLKVGMVSLLETTNILAASNNMRSVGRLIYDRLAYFDEKLNTIPWAVESWTRLDNRTWDIRLRPGMKFHDGKPVTAEDLKFTLDFLVKYERGIFWTANQFLESVEIVDAARGVLRTKFKEPYGQFESYFL
jgi:peptide/nickel transport system substrate-binding protein